MVYPHSEILFDNKKKCSIDTCYTIDEPWKHYSKWNKPFKKDQILYGSIEMKCLEQEDL